MLHAVGLDSFVWHAKNDLSCFSAMRSILFVSVVVADSGSRRRKLSIVVPV